MTIAIVLLAFGMAGITVVARRESRPLAELRSAAVAMSRGELHAPVVPHGAAETASLVRAFNQMAEAIRDGQTVLEARNLALEEANNARDRFLAVMSHELRTPLHAIAGHTELLALGIHGPVTSEQLRTLRRIERNNEQMLHLVNDMLHLSRPNGSRIALELEPVALDDVLDVIRGNATRRFEEKGVGLTMPPTDFVAVADRMRLQQVLENLLANALRFTESGGEVEVRVRPEGTELHIAVADNGIGIPPEHVHAVFEPFVQVDNRLTRRSGGAGLGLAIVRQLTEAMGGRVWLESEPGRGSTFTVAFPASADEKREAEMLGAGHSSPVRPTR